MEGGEKMSQKLTNLVVNEVSLVDEGAIGEKFSIIKSATPPTKTVIEKSDDAPSEGVISFITKAIDTALIAVGIKKAKKTSFSEAVAAREISDIFYGSFWTLEDVVWNIMYDDTIADKVAAIKTATNEFATYINSKLEDASVEKLEKARNEFSEAITKRAIKKSKNEEEDKDMTPEQIAEVIAKALGPVVESISALSEQVGAIEKAKTEVTPDPATAVVAKEVTPDPAVVVPEANLADVIAKALGPVVESITGLSGRIATIEKAETPSAVVAGQDLGTAVKKSRWPSFTGGE